MQCYRRIVYNGKHEINPYHQRNQDKFNEINPSNLPQTNACRVIITSYYWRHILTQILIYISPEYACCLKAWNRDLTDI